MAYSEIKSGKPKFSVIMPLYNKEAYVERALKSILVQSYQDWELIVVNDGSTDGSFDVASKAIKGDGRCRIINQVNAGVGAARNNGVTESTGDFLCFLDADDWWGHPFLEEMDKFIKEYPDAGIYASNYIYFKPGKTRIGLTHSTGYMNYSKTYYETGVMPITSITACIPRKVFCEDGGFPENIKLGEDFLLWSKIAFKHKVAFLDKPLAYYNNEIPPSQRATRHLYAPENHMIYNMEWLENKVSEMKDNGGDWKNLMDMLRVNSLLDYWLSKEYHQRAVEELKKVDWSRQPKSVIRKYKLPIWLMRCKNNFMEVGSKIKGIIILPDFKTGA